MDRIKRRCDQAVTKSHRTRKKKDEYQIAFSSPFSSKDFRRYKLFSSHVTNTCAEKVHKITNNKVTKLLAKFQEEWTNVSSSNKNMSNPAQRDQVSDGPSEKLWREEEVGGGGKVKYKKSSCKGKLKEKNLCTASCPEKKFLHTEKIFLQGKC